MEVSLILDNKLVRSFDFTRSGRKNIKTLDYWKNEIVNFNTNFTDRNELRAINKWVGNIKVRNKKLYKSLVFCIACINISTVVLADTGEVFIKIEKVGELILSVLKKVGFWFCLICCFVEILKSFVNSSNKDVWKVFFKYISIYLILNALPFIFKLIAEIFDGM